MVSEMGSDVGTILHNCLYFTVNSLARQITHMAEEEFRFTGLSPSHAFLLMLVNEQPGITQKELSEALHLAPSTVTRLVDSLRIPRDLVERRTEGKSARIFPTDQGRDLQDLIAKCWKGLYHRYSKILGEAEGCDLTKAIDQASERIKE